MQKKIFQEKVRIVANKKVGSPYYKLSLAAGKIAAVAKPGQFLQVKVSDALEPLLRRPFSIHKISHKVEILYEVVGKGSEILSSRKTGELLDVIGPLGNGFDIRRAPPAGQAGAEGMALLVAGGMGVAPFVFLAEAIAERKTIVLIGAKTRKHILCEKEFKRLGCEVRTSTDDGSMGFKGKVTQCLENFLRHASPSGRLRFASHPCAMPYAIYACGPRPMLREISRISCERHIPAQVSMEEHMSCGIGACLGCVVNTIDGFKRVCMEGPVFEAQEIIWRDL